HRVTGARTVEHLACKSKSPEQAYEWSNYRLVCLRMNERKHVFEDVLDPFHVEDGWFQIEFVTFRVVPNRDLTDANRALVEATIERLRLNDGDCRSSRQEEFEDYLHKGLSWTQLLKWSPFLAAEVARQGISRSDDKP
ncbi:MAG: hypothetical protein HYU66_26335, partial [Armatimonadetes bacterium]|nr:hypothetical protein [Armatimonadota bacterium]